MKQWTWPFVVVVIAVVAGIVAMFGLADDVEMQKQLIEHFDSILLFVIGGAAGGAVGGTLGYGTAKGIIG